MHSASLEQFWKWLNPNEELTQGTFPESCSQTASTGTQDISTGVKCSGELLSSPHKHSDPAFTSFGGNQEQLLGTRGIQIQGRRKRGLK